MQTRTRATGVTRLAGMAVGMNPAQTDVFASLRGDRGERPSVRPGLRQELQRDIEEALRDVEGPLTIEKSALNKVHQCEGRYLAVDEFSWTPANAKGTIAHKAIELSAGGVAAVTPDHLVKLAMERITEVPQSLGDYIEGLGQAERAELRVAVTDIVIKFLEMFPPISPHWRANAEAMTAAYVGNRRVVFRGKIDLKLGELTSDRSNTLIIDIKTGNPSFTDMDDLRFYALLETLRTGVPPYRWANVYVTAGRAEFEDVNEGILWSAAKRLVDGTRKIASLLETREPVLTAGTGCKFCPANQRCEAASTMAAKALDLRAAWASE